MREIFGAAFSGLLLFALSGCVSAAVGGTTYAVKASQRGGLQPAAEAGDAQAQYQLGLAHCCMGIGFSAQTATEWLCKSAAQGYPLAQYELGRIYAGDIARTRGLGRQVRETLLVRSEPVSSLVWFTLAASGGSEQAAEKLERAEARLSEADLVSAQERLADWQSMACEYEQVFPDHENES